MTYWHTYTGNFSNYLQRRSEQHLRIRLTYRSARSSSAPMFAYSSAWYAVTDGSWLESLLLVCFVMLWITAEADSSTTTSGFSYLIFFTSFQFQFFSA